MRSKYLAQLRCLGLQILVSKFQYTLGVKQFAYASRLAAWLLNFRIEA